MHTGKFPRYWLDINKLEIFLLYFLPLLVSVCRNYTFTRCGSSNCILRDFFLSTTDILSPEKRNTSRYYYYMYNTTPTTCRHDYYCRIRILLDAKHTVIPLPLVVVYELLLIIIIIVDNRVIFSYIEEASAYYTRRQCVSVASYNRLRVSIKVYKHILERTGGMILAFAEWKMKEKKKSHVNNYARRVMGNRGKRRDFFYVYRFRVCIYLQ